MTGARRLDSTALARVLAAVAVAVLSLPTALALSGEDRSPGRVVAEPPLLVEGRGEARLDGDGLVLFGSGRGQPVTFVLSSLLLNVTTYTTTLDCVALPFGGPGSCAPIQDEADREVLHLRDAQVETRGATRDDFEGAISLRRGEHLDEFAAGQASTLTLRHPTGAKPAELTLAKDAPMGGAGSSQAGFSYYVGGPSYAPREGDFAYVAAAIGLEATGWVEAYLRGVDVRVTGHDEDGRSIARDFRTGETRESNSDGATERRTFVKLVVEAPFAETAIAYPGTAVAYGAPAVTSFDSVALDHASGDFAAGGASYAPRDESVKVEGEATFVPEAMRQAPEGERIILRVLSAEPVAETAAPPTSRARDAAPAISGATAGAAVFGVLGGLAALAYYWPSVRYALTLAVVPLYSRIERDDVLHHDKREEIYGLIRAQPGIHAHEISERARIGWGTTVYHLRLLEGHQLVVSKRAGRYKRFFLTSGAVGGTKDAYGVLRNDTAARVGQFILKNPGVSQKDACAALGLSPSLVSWHVDRLEEAELVKKLKEGRRVRYFGGPAWNQINMTVVPTLAASGGISAPIATGGSVPGAAAADGERGKAS